LTKATQFTLVPAAQQTEYLHLRTRNLANRKETATFHKVWTSPTFAEATQFTLVPAAHPTENNHKQNLNLAKRKETATFHKV
jgi:hypothetical protein